MDADRTLVAKLRQRNLRVTPQRLVIYRALDARPQHLTAEQVLEAVVDTLPGLSMPTVYATLELFDELGLVRRIATGTGATLYDSRTGPHAHAVCTRCAAVVDLDADVDLEPLRRRARRAGYAIDYAQIVVRGRCGACRRRDAERPTPAGGGALPSTAST